PRLADRSAPERSAGHGGVQPGSSGEGGGGPAVSPQGLDVLVPVHARSRGGGARGAAPQAVALGCQVGGGHVGGAVVVSVGIQQPRGAAGSHADRARSGVPLEDGYVPEFCALESADRLRQAVSDGGGLDCSHGFFLGLVSWAVRTRRRRRGCARWSTSALRPPA